MRRALWLGAAALTVYVGACSKGSDQPRQADGGSRIADTTTAGSAKSTPGASRNPDSLLSAPASGVAKQDILFAGTSLTAGLGLDPDSAYPMLIQRKIDSAGLQFAVTNAGVSGETSSGFLDRLDWLMKGKFSVLVLETGANDGLRGIPVATLKKNLETALDRIKAARPDAKVVLVQMEALPNLGPKYASDFHNAYVDVAKAKGVTLLPFLLAGVAGDRSLNQNDGVHPNDRGEHIVADNVWRGLLPVLSR